MNFLHSTFRALLLGLPLFALHLPAQASDAAGKVVMLTGQATAMGADGTVRRLAKNDAVFSGDLINSGLGSYVNLKFADGAFFLLRPDTRFEVQDYRYAAPATAAAPGTAAAPTQTSRPETPAPGAAPLATAQTPQASGASRAFFRLVKGGFRSVSGLIGKISRDDYRVETPVATIGIRGTQRPNQRQRELRVERVAAQRAIQGEDANTVLLAGQQHRIGFAPARASAVVAAWRACATSAASSTETARRARFSLASKGVRACCVAMLSHSRVSPTDHTWR